MLTLHMNNYQYNNKIIIFYIIYCHLRLFVPFISILFLFVMLYEETMHSAIAYPWRRVWVKQAILSAGWHYRGT